MFPQKAYLLLFICIIICCYDVTARRGRGNRPRGRGSRYGGRRRYWFPPHHDQTLSSPCDVIACSFTDGNGKVLEERSCPPTYECNRGPLQVFIGRKDYYFRFCNVPFSPELSQSCRHEVQWHWWSDYFYHSSYVQSCPNNETCEGGPVEITQWGYRYRLYFCGSRIPTEPNYKDALTKAACNINGHITRSCGYWNRCGSLQLTLSSQSGNNSVKFCSMSDDIYLNLFGTPCRGYAGGYWFSPTVTKHGSPSDEDNTNVSTSPKPVQSSTEESTQKPSNTTEASVDTGGVDQPDTGVEAPPERDNLP